MNQPKITISYNSPSGHVQHGTWEAGPGETDFHFEWDETVYVLEGKARVLNLVTGESQELIPGTLATFEKGSKWRWSIPWKFKKVFTIID